MKALVVVDMQNDFIGGSLGTPEAQLIVPNVKKKIDEYVENGDWVIFTQDTHRDDYLVTKEGEKLPVKHCIQNTYGWEISNELQVPYTYGRTKRIVKYTFGSTSLVSFIDYLLSSNAIEEIELVGLCTDICVVSNALLLKAYFYETCEISVDAACCAGVTPQTHGAALKTMQMCQINIKRG